MAADGEAVVGAKENVGIISLPTFLQRIEHTTNLRIHVLNDRVVLLPMDFYGVLGTRHRREVFIA